MIVSRTHDDLEEPPRVPMITGLVPKRQKKETLSDALAGTATAFVKAFHSTPTTPVSNTPASSVGISPGKTADIRIKNLQQLRFLQQHYFRDFAQPRLRYLLNHDNIPVFQTLIYFSLHACSCISLSLGNPASLIHVM